MIYLDNSATTKPYKEVIESFVKVSSDFFGNPSSLHKIGLEAEKLLKQGRKQIADRLNVQPEEIIFTSGGTESNNLAIKGAAMKFRNRGKHIITSSVEHSSVTNTMKQLEEFGFEVSYLPVDENGRVRVADLEKAIRPDTILVSVIHVNNEVGTIQPIEEIGELLKNHPKILFHVDHVQGAGKVPLDFYRSSIDLCSLSGHKFHGLKGTGILFIRNGVNISPLFTGGSQEYKIRSGTENVAGMVAMAKALRMTMEKYERDISKLIALKEKMIDGLSKIDGITVNTPKEHSAPHIINFSIHGFKSEVFVHALEEENIYVSTTSACSSKEQKGSKTLLAMNLSPELAKSAIRVSLSFENTMDEITHALNVIEDKVKTLREVME